MPYTHHGHWYGPGEPTQPGPQLVARCGGPGLCPGCSREAAASPMPETVVTGPEATCDGCDVCATTPCAGGCKAFTGELGQPMHICADEQACWDAFGKAAVQP